MLMGMGDWPRILTFVRILTAWNFDDFHDLKNPIEPMTVEIPGVGFSSNVRTYLFKVLLMESFRRPEWNYGISKTAYAQAMENGHKKCARKLFKWLLSIKQYLPFERLSVIGYHPDETPRRMAKREALVAALSKKEDDRRRAMTAEERKKEDDARKIRAEVANKNFASKPSLAELFVVEAKEVMMLEEATVRNREHYAELRRLDRLKAAEKREKLKTRVRQSLSPQKPLPGSPEAHSMTSRYSFNRTSPTKSPSPRARSMPNIPSMPKFSAKSHSAPYIAMPDDSEGG
jgi:hypothetical protein